MPSYRRTNLVLLFIVLASTLLSVSTARAADQTNYDLFKRIQEQVLRYSFFTVFDNVDAEVGDDGHIVLTGHVTGEHKAGDIEKRVAALDGVTAVTNKISVLPASRFDDQLRYRVARAIYGNSMFQHYIVRPNPSIHIVVERGHVTLIGVVNNEIDRHLAGVLATQFNAFSVTNELLLPDEVTAKLEALG